MPEAAMHLVAWLPPDMSTKGLHILPVSQFSLRPLQRDGLMLGFASSSSEELQAGVQTLALALRKR